MLNSGNKFRALRDKKNKYSNSRVVRKKNSERNQKTYPPCKLNGRSLSNNVLCNCFRFFYGSVKILLEYFF